MASWANLPRKTRNMLQRGHRVAWGLVSPTPKPQSLRFLRPTSEGHLLVMQRAWNCEATKRRTKATKPHSRFLTRNTKGGEGGTDSGGINRPASFAVAPPAVASWSTSSSTKISSACVRSSDVRSNKFGDKSKIGAPQKNGGCVLGSL